MTRKNCWEVIQCGRQPGGNTAEELGVCPASLPSQHDGTNNGKHGGRLCWAIAGTFCGGKPQGSGVEKIMDCIHCKFLKQVHDEESNDFVLLPDDKKSKTG